MPGPDKEVPRLQALEPQPNAGFGYTMGKGQLFGDPLDDVVVSAPGEDEGLTRDQTGAAYVFVDKQLTAPDLKPHRLLATGLPSDPTGNPPSDAQLGRLGVAIGNPRGAGFGNLLFVGSAGHDAEYPGIGPNAGGGSVEMWDYTQGGLDPPQKSIFAPLNTPNVVPTEVRLFGHGLTLGDVTSDGLPDLIVGAPNTTVTFVSDECATQESPTIEKVSPGLGRVYVLRGHTGFYGNPHAGWIGLNAVEPKFDCVLSPSLDHDWGKEFGCDVAACNFTDAVPMEILVGREDRGLDATISTPQLAPLGGSAYVFRGSYLSNLFLGAPYDPATNPTGTLNKVHQPPWPDQSLAQGGLNPAVPEYQVLRNPMGDLQPYGTNPRHPLWECAYGWKVRSGGDLGSPYSMAPSFGGLDGIDTAVVYAEVCDYIGTGTLDAPQVPDAGGVWFYHGSRNSGAVMVYDDRDASRDHKDALLVQRPDSVALPLTGAHFGRSFGRLETWRASQTAEPAPAILIGELNAFAPAPKGQGTEGGLVYMFRPPLPGPHPLGPAHAVDWDNVWANFPLFEPIPVMPEKGTGHHFGSDILVANYKPESEVNPDILVSEPRWVGEEFIVSAREAAVTDFALVVQLGAGRAFPFTQPPVTPFSTDPP